MRAGMHPKVIKSENGEFQGFALDYGACTEHESGNAILRRSLGITEPAERDKPELWGVGGRKIRRYNPPSFFFGINRTHAILSFNANPGWDHYELKKEPKDISAVWDDGAFAIIVAEPYIGNLEELYKAFQTLDVMVTVSGGVFGGDGLIIVIASRVEEAVKQQLFMADSSADKLRRASEPTLTGLKAILKAAGLRYYALSPHWKNMETGVVGYRLNPMEQNMYNCGLFTAEEIKEWAQGRGPVIIKNK